MSSYLSTTKKWKISRNVEGFHHVEAKYYGSQYVESKSRKQLEFAVYSLLDVARASSILPCRNFWGKGLGNIGTGIPAIPELPSVEKNQETRMYVDENGEPVIWLRINKKIIW
jgi:hypothetical protein